MKKTSIIILLSLLLLAVTLLMGCVDEGKAPDNSDGETAETTAPEVSSDAASLNPWGDMPAAEAFNQLMEALEAESGEGEETMDNGRIDLDMTLSVVVSTEGMENTSTVPLKVAIILDGENMQLDGNLLGSTAGMTYKDGVLYLSAVEGAEDLGKIKCLLTPEEFETVAAIIFGTEDNVNPEEGDISVPELPGIADLKPAELFASMVSEVDETNGDIIITGKGLNSDLASELAPLLQPMLEGLGLAGGGEWDENGELITDPAVALAEVVNILRGLNEETMQLSVLFDKEGKLLSTSVDITIAAEDTDGLTDTKTEVGLKGSFAVQVGGQKVEAPADADEYTEMDWRVIFDMETAEMLELLPDANGCVTLSDDPARRERQILYIYNHSDEMLGVTYNLKGYLTETYVVDEETATRPVDIGALEGMITLCPPMAEEDYTTVLSFQIPLSMKGEGYPADGTYVQVKNAKLELVEDEFWGSYMYIVMTDYAVIDPVESLSVIPAEAIL